MALLIYVTQQTTYVHLRTGLSPAEASKVTQKLDEMQVPYVLENGGTTIMVPSQRKDQAILNLASSPDLHLGEDAGYYILDNLDFSATEFQQNIQAKRALEGEISNLLRKINFVRDVDVLLALQKQSLFIDNERKTTASVRLTLQDSGRLSNRKVETILNIVAGSVPGLSPENVKMTDQRGNTYVQFGEEFEAADRRAKNFIFQRQKEQYLENKILMNLEKILGKGRVQAQVTAKLSFDSSEEEISKVDPDGSAIVSEKISSEIATGSRSIPVGIPGVTTNSPESIAGADSIANVSDRELKTTQRNYQNTTSKIKRRIDAGQIEYLSISVILDYIDDKTNEIKLQSPIEQIEQIKNIAKRAVGFDEKRGDTIEVAQFDFVKTREEEQQKVEIETQNWRNFIELSKLVVVPLVLLMVIFFIIKPMVQKLSAKPEDLDLLMGLPTTIGELEGEELEIPIEKDVGIPPRDKIIELAKEDPLRTASLIRTWLRDKKIDT